VWRFFLADSTTSPPTLIGDLTGAQSMKLTLALNKSGGCSFDLSMMNPLADDIQPITTCIVAYKNAQAIWSGPVWTIDENLPTARMSVSAVGWFELLNNRILHDAVNYNLVVGGQIAVNLLNITNAISATRITSSTANVHDTQTRTRDYERWQNIGAAITELTEIENGFDFVIDPLTRVMSFYPSPTLGGPNPPQPTWHDRTNVVFGYGWGPDNLSSFQRNIDASQTMNTIFVSGKNGTYGPGIDADSIAAYGAFEQQVSLSDVADVDVLTAYAAEEIVFRRTPRVIYSITPYPVGSTRARTPDPLVDYGLGDQIYLTARYRKRLSIQNQAVRVFGMEIDIDENGNEKLGPLQVAP
jgi:hypothetical protein